MKLAQTGIFISLFTILFYSSCNPVKLSSNYNLSSTAKNNLSSPEQEAIDLEKQTELFNRAVEKMSQTPHLLSIQNAENTSWTYLGYKLLVPATSGRTTSSYVISRTKTQIEFSELRQEQCPAGMMCPQVYKPYVEARFSNQCQNAVYRLFENLKVPDSMVPVTNYNWTAVSEQKNQGCTNEDDSLFTTLSAQITQNDPLIFIADRFLYIRSGSITYMFNR